MNEKRKKVQDHILKHVSVLDPSGFNAQRYQKLFSNLNDKDFDLFMQHLEDVFTSIRSEYASHIEDGKHYQMCQDAGS